MNDPVLRLVLLTLAAVAAGYLLLGNGRLPHVGSGGGGVHAPNGTMARGLAPAGSGVLGRAIK